MSDAHHQPVAFRQGLGHAPVFDVYTDDVAQLRTLVGRCLLFSCRLSDAPHIASLTLPLVDAHLVAHPYVLDFQYGTPLGGVEVLGSGLCAFRRPFETEETA